MEYAYQASGDKPSPEQVSAPRGAVRAPFSASAEEKLGAFAMYLLAYVYVSLDLYSPHGRSVMLAVFTLGFAALTECLHRRVPRARESWIWLGCMAACLLSLLLRDGGRVWGDGTFWFLHVFAVWWVLSRSGTLLEGESGHLLPLDALDGFVVFPFRHFLLRIRCVWNAASALRGDRKKVSAVTAVWTALALAFAVPLLVTSINLLSAADDGFADLLSGLSLHLRWDWDAEFPFRLLCSLPVGAYLFGLIAGAAREDRAALRARGEGVGRALAQFRQVPQPVWLTVLSLFCALYLVFFFVQGRYLFGAFTRTLPEGFIVSRYARQGFFELCKVMAVNFALLWLVTRSARRDGRLGTAATGLCLALLAESLLFAVIAFSKLALYISCFGFTPKRLQSTWLVCVLAFGCVCAAVSLLRGKKTMRAWMVFGAATLALLCLY